MTGLLVRLFVKDRENVTDARVRRTYGSLAGIVGIVVNLLLFAAKFTVGTLFASIAVSADAVNNLSDAGSSLVSLISFKISSKPADRDHPFGHARIEYVASLAVSFLILFVGVELFRSSFDKILHPSEPEAGVVMIVVLSLSVLVKLWLGFFYRGIGKKIGSSVLRASGIDSFSDAVSTFAVLVSVLILRLFRVNLDGWFGLLVSVLIVVAGLKILNETKNTLLGEAPPPELVETIKKTALSCPEILGIHDLLVHSYGSGVSIASFHAEVDGKGDPFALHDAIDNVEKRLYDEENIRCTIHMDPIVTDDERVMELRERVTAKIREIDDRLRVHDFRFVAGVTHSNLIFDMEVPFEEKRTDAQMIAAVREKVQEIDEAYMVVMTVDRV